MAIDVAALPLVLCGPMLRRVEARSVLGVRRPQGTRRGPAGGLRRNDPVHHGRAQPPDFRARAHGPARPPSPRRGGDVAHPGHRAGAGRRADLRLRRRPARRPGSRRPHPTGRHRPARRKSPAGLRARTASGLLPDARRSGSPESVARLVPQAARRGRRHARRRRRSPAPGGRPRRGLRPAAPAVAYRRPDLRRRRGARATEGIARHRPGAAGLGGGLRRHSDGHLRRGTLPRRAACRG